MQSEVEKLEKELKELESCQEEELRALKYEVPLQEVADAAAQAEEKQSRQQVAQLAVWRSRAGGFRRRDVSLACQ